MNMNKDAANGPRENAQQMLSPWKWYKSELEQNYHYQLESTFVANEIENMTNRNTAKGYEYEWEHSKC